MKMLELGGVALKISNSSALIAACAVLTILGLTGCGDSALFEKTGNAFSKSITVLNH